MRKYTTAPSKEASPCYKQGRFVETKSKVPALRYLLRMSKPQLLFITETLLQSEFINRSGGIRTHDLHYPKVASTKLRYALTIISTHNVLDN